MQELPLTVHDTAITKTPFPTAVSRVTLRPWCVNPHPSTARFLRRQPPLVWCLCDALTWVTAEAPNFSHGMLISGVQKEPDGPVLPPVVGTLRQYVSARTALGVAIIAPPTGLKRVNAPGHEYEHLVVYDLDRSHHTAKWVWHMLAGSLLHEVSTLGEPPVKT